MSGHGAITGERRGGAGRGWIERSLRVREIGLVLALMLGLLALLNPSHQRNQNS